MLNRKGEFQGFSANYSGAGFSGMRFQLKGVDDAAFSQWLEEARAGGRELGLPAYREIVAPSEKVPVMRFASIDHDLYRRILERCVEPGTPCMSELMQHPDHAQESQGDASP